MGYDPPLVSVIVPCYNHARFIVQCIESIIHQTYSNFELVVIDDGSTDESPELLKSLQSTYKFNLIIQENKGICSTLNFGVKNHSSGKYIALCASDDYWVPEKLDIQVKAMETNPEWGMCYGKNFFVDNESRIITGYYKDYHKLKGGWIFDDIFLFKFHPQVNYMIRRDVITNAGFYNSQFLTEDYYMNLKIASLYPIGFIDAFIGYYRIPTSAIKLRKYEQFTQSHIQIINTYENHPLYAKAIRRAYLRNFDTYSGFTKFKTKAIGNMFRVIPLFYFKRFFVATIKLLFFYKSIDQ